MSATSGCYGRHGPRAVRPARQPAPQEPERKRVAPLCVLAAGMAVDAAPGAAAIATAANAAPKGMIGGGATGGS